MEWNVYISLRYSRLEPRLAHGINFDHLDSFIFDWVILLWCYLFSIVSMNMCTIYIYIHTFIAYQCLISYFPSCPPPKQQRQQHHDESSGLQRGQLQDPLTLGAMSEDAWKEVRLPLGLKELLGTKSKSSHQKRHKKQVLINHFCEWLLVCCFFIVPFFFQESQNDLASEWTWCLLHSSLGV